MSTIPRHKYTLEEYIELDKNSEGRWEYFAGEVVDMAGGSLEHNQIVSNMVRVLWQSASRSRLQSVVLRYAPESSQSLSLPLS